MPLEFMVIKRKLNLGRNVVGLLENLLMNLIFKFSKAEVEKCHLQNNFSFGCVSIGDKDDYAPVYCK